MEASRVKTPYKRSTDDQAVTIKYCDRCARRSKALFFDDLTLQELCQDCCDRLTRRRGTVAQPADQKR